MANPQKENGFTPIANEIVEALMGVNLSAYESRVLWFLFRKTYGWEKKTDWIALSQFSKCIGLDRRHIHRALKGLSSKKMIVIDRGDNFNIRYGFQKNYERWKVSSKKMTVTYRDDKASSKEMTTVTNIDDEVSSIQAPTKETITKEIKIKYSPNSDEVRMSEFLFSLISARDGKAKKPNLQEWAVHIDRLIRLDNRSPIEIRAVIEWCQGDPFWQNNILSAEKLRKQFGQLILKMRGDDGRNTGGKQPFTGKAKSDGQPYPVDVECNE